MESERKNYSKCFSVKRGEVFIFKLSCRQVEGFVKELFTKAGIVTHIPNFFDYLPQNPQDILQDFVIFLDATGVNLISDEEWSIKKHLKRRLNYRKHDDVTSYTLHK